MNSSPIDLKTYGIDVGLLISGLFGAILLTSKHSAMNLARTIYSLIGGAASANYITPIVIKLTNLDEAQYHYSIAFILGFLGLKGIEFFSNKILPSESLITNNINNTPTRSTRRRRIKKHK